MGGNDRPCPSLPIFYKYRENNELSPFSGGEKCVLGMIFWYFSQERAATNLRTGRQVRTARPGVARSPCFSLYIYARFRLRTNSIHHLKTLDYGRTTGQQPAVDGHPLVMDEKGTLQAVSGVKDGELQTKNPLEDNNDLLRWIATAICFRISFPTSGTS